MTRLLFTSLWLLLGIFSVGMMRLQAQSDSSSLVLSAYLEAYYSFDLGQPADHLRPAFFYNFNRHNEVNLNLGFVKASLNRRNMRANLGLMAGTYAQYNLAAEQDLLQHVFEANAGMKLSPKKELWLDAGVLPSHIGFESAIGKDCWTLTRSLMAENSPYYEAGARLAYTSPDAKWYLAALYLNGWQRIQRLNGNQTPAFGTQLTYKLPSGSLFNWSTFVGNEQAGEEERWRYFNNFYALWALSPRLGITAGFDIGWQQDASRKKMDLWYSPLVLARYQVSDKLSATARLEYYDDQKGGIISAPNSSTGFQTFAYSLNLDYSFATDAVFRIEGRGQLSQSELFIYQGQPSRQNYFITTSLAVSLHE